MRILCLISFSLLLSCRLAAQAPVWQWSNAGSALLDDVANSIAASDNGSVAMAGTFRGPSLTIGSFTMNNPTLGLEDVVVVKYDASGNVLWARGVSGDSIDYANEVASDATGNVYVTGMSSSSSLTFYGVSTNSLTITFSQAGTNVFVGKYNSAGDILWVKEGLPSGSSDVQSISVDPAGNVFIGGWFMHQSITFDSNTLFNPGSNQSTSQVFLVKYDSTGVVQWVRQDGGLSSEICSGIAADIWGNLYVAGTFSGDSAVFGNIVLHNTYLGTQDAFLVKYDGNGNAIWGRNLTGQAHDVIREVKCDANGNVVIAGQYFSPVLNIGAVSIINADNNGVVSDFFVAKFDSSGTALWANGSGCVGNDGALALAVGSGSKVYITGYFYGGPLTVGSSTVNSTNGRMYIAEYTSSGIGVWIKSAGGTGIDNSYGVSADSLGHVCMAGGFKSPTIVFDQAYACTDPEYDYFIAAVQSLTTIVEVKSESSFSLFPNPSNRTATLISSVDFNNTTLEIIDCTGRVVQRQTSLSGNVVEIDCTDLAQGIYVVQLNDAAGVRTQRLVVQ